MKEITIQAINGITQNPVVTKAIPLGNCIKWSDNKAGFCIVRFDKKPGTNTQPESLTLNINKATFDALVATVTSVTTLSLSVLDPETKVATVTGFNEKYLVSMQNSKAYLAGAVDSTVVEVTYADGSYINRKVFVDGALSSLVASNLAELALAFLTVEDVEYTVNGDARTINALVPFGTVITALEASFYASPSYTSVKVGGVSQVSGVTPNDFTTAKTYVVIAQDGVTTRNWVVSVTIADIYA